MRWASLLVLAGISCVPATLPVVAQEDKPVHVETSFEVMVRASYLETAELFSPEGERAWAGEHWDPQFIYPLGAEDKQGAVFTIKHGALQAVWVTARRDLDARHFQYVYFIPDVMVTTIDVRFSLLDAKTTKVNVTYARTAIRPDGDAHVKAMSEGDQRAGKEWQDAIDQYLASRKSKHQR